MTAARPEFDVAIVGAGIVGLGCALAAARRGLKVVVIDRELRARGASVRNFGFVTVTGQDRDTVWPLARRARDIWETVAPAAGIAVTQRGLWLVAQRPEAAAVLEAFMHSGMADGCRLLSAAEARRQCPELATASLAAVLTSPHELRVESREALPALAAWLGRAHGVEFRWQTAVLAVDPPSIATARGTIAAQSAIVCPGDELATLYPERLAAAGITRCTLQMLRLESPGFTLPGTLMADLSLVRYGGFSKLAAAAALQRRLLAEQPQCLEHGIHLIVAQSSDGSLVVGDSHHYDSATEPFAVELVDQLLLAEYRKVTGRQAPAVRERWTGRYTVAADRVLLVESVSPRVRLVVVTSGVGASTGFAIGEDVVAGLYN